MAPGRAGTVRRRVGGAAGALLALGLAAPETAGAQPAAGQPGPGQPVFRAGVTLVTTDVIVRDADGAFIPDLTRDDFRIYEDGRPQAIASFVLVHGGRVFNQLLPPAPVREGIVLPPAAPAAPRPGRIFILFIDDLHIAPADTPLIHRVLDLLPDTLIHEGDEFAILSTGKSGVRVDVTTDRSRLAALDRVVGEGMTPRQLITAQMATASLQEARWRAHLAFKSARDTVRGLETIRHRRKAFLYVSSGYDLNPFQDARILARIRSMEDAGFFEGRETDLPEFTDPHLDQFVRLDGQGAVFSDAELHLELLQLADAANRANVSFYTLDPRGLTGIPDLDVDLRASDWSAFVRRQHNSLRTLAELTGGEAVVNRNTFREAFAGIDAETSDYYVLGFHSDNPDADHRLRRLRIEVTTRPDAEVRSRSWYALPFTDAPAAGADEPAAREAGRPARR